MSTSYSWPDSKKSRLKANAIKLIWKINGRIWSAATCRSFFLARTCHRRLRGALS
jgi:hypothetical protein